MENIQYDKQGRLKYNPEFHFKHGKVWSEEELEYLCKFFETDGARLIGFALGKTETVVATKVNVLKREGLYEYYKNMNNYFL